MAATRNASRSPRCWPPRRSGPAGPSTSITTGRRSGRHFGGWEEGNRTEATGSGSLMAGGRHLDHALWLTTCYRVVALGDPASPLWPVVESSGECALRSSDPAALYETAFRLLGPADPGRGGGAGHGAADPARHRRRPLPLPAPDGGPLPRHRGRRRRGPCGSGWRCWGPGASSASASTRCAPAGFPAASTRSRARWRGESYASFSAGLARRHAAWGRGTLLGDPDLIAGAAAAGGGQAPAAALRPAADRRDRACRRPDPHRGRPGLWPAVRRPRLLRARPAGPRVADRRSRPALRQHRRAAAAPSRNRRGPSPTSSPTTPRCAAGRRRGGC